MENDGKLWLFMVKFFPFIAPPSSPASFLPSDPASATQSPAGVLSLASLSVHAYSPGQTPSIFTNEPYAHETQLVSRPIFSTFTTEPSTANYTPPADPVQMTLSSSPEVPFAELLSSSLARNRRNSNTNLKYSFSQYEFQTYQHPGSPGGHSNTPGSAVSTSGTSSPFPNKAPRYIGYEHNGWGSRLGTGASTPDGLVSRLCSGTLTPNNGNLPENQISEVASLANSDHDGDVVVDHRVSFELIGEDIPTSIMREPDEMGNLCKAIAESEKEKYIKTIKRRNSENVNEVLEEQEECNQKNHTVSLGSSKDFIFNNANGEVSDKDKVIGKELDPQNSWTFFPVLQSGIRVYDSLNRFRYIINKNQLSGIRVLSNT